MTETEFSFNRDADINKVLNQIKVSFADIIGVDPSKIKCKGLRIFFVEEDSQMLMSSGLFASGFSPEDWDDEGDP